MKPDLSRLPLPDLSSWSPARRWLLLFGVTTVATTTATSLSIPAGVLLSAMLSGIFVALCKGEVVVPPSAFMLAQSVVGCMIARSISADTLRDILDNWPLFVLMVVSVSFIASLLGWLLARTGALPGTTAIWGTSPGAALVMTLMSEGYGADSRLVAFMQYTRVLMVSLTASIVAAIWGEPSALVQGVRTASFDQMEFLKTAALIGGCAVLSKVTRLFPSPIIMPLIIVPAFTISGLVTLQLPWWLLWASYFIVGWRIGLRYTRSIVEHALGAFGKIIITILGMIVSCGLIGMAFGFLAGIDPLTAYLATSPGGMDTVAIIASSTGGNMSLVMAVQVTRFILVTATSPSLARAICIRSGFTGCDKN